MPQPEVRRSQDTVRAEWRERFIQRQIAGLRGLGLSPAALAREEALLRGGFAAGAVFSGLPDRSSGA
jgi:hypothetical protein